MNFTVRVSLEVSAESADAALDQVSRALQVGFKGSDIAAVGILSVAKGAPKLLDKLPPDKGGDEAQ